MSSRTFQLAKYLMVGLLSTAPAFASEDGLTQGTKSDREAIQACLANWQTHPFKDKKPSFKVLKSGVKVIGIGKNTGDDDETDNPTLVLIKPSVHVLSGSTFALMNPNGWYCFKSSVTVLGSSKIKLACKAHLASAKDGSAVLGSNPDDHGGVTVLGKLSINRVGCSKSKKQDHAE